jgi:hypothetical protein
MLSQINKAISLFNPITSFSSTNNESQTRTPLTEYNLFTQHRYQTLQLLFIHLAAKLGYFKGFHIFKGSGCCVCAIPFLQGKQVIGCYLAERVCVIVNELLLFLFILFYFFQNAHLMRQRLRYLRLLGGTGRQFGVPYALNIYCQVGYVRECAGIKIADI